MRIQQTSLDCSLRILRTTHTRSFMKANEKKVANKEKICVCVFGEIDCEYFFN